MTYFIDTAIQNEITFYGDDDEITEVVKRFIHYDPHVMRQTVYKEGAIVQDFCYIRFIADHATLNLLVSKIDQFMEKSK